MISIFMIGLNLYIARMIIDKKLSIKSYSKSGVVFTTLGYKSCMEYFQGLDWLDSIYIYI